MVQFTTTILQFGEQGEKTGWTYIPVPADLAQQLLPGNKKSFRVKGRLDDHPIEGIALVPMGGGDFILPLNADLRKAIRKKKGAMLQVTLLVDTNTPRLSNDFLACLGDEPTAKAFFATLTKGHQLYFSRWIESAKTEATKTKRIAMAVDALSRHWDYGTMIREERKNRDLFMG